MGLYFGHLGWIQNVVEATREGWILYVGTNLIWVCITPPVEAAIVDEAKVINLLN
jgi:hypothetical protein